jgi:flagellar capping protein FliD
MFVLALANVPTIIIVLIGMLLNNGRLNDLNARMSSLDSRLASMDSRIAALDHKFDTRFDVLLGNVVELDNRLTRIETQRR